MIAILIYSLLDNVSSSSSTPIMLTTTYASFLEASACFLSFSASSSYYFFRAYSFCLRIFSSD